MRIALKPIFVTAFVMHASVACAPSNNTDAGLDASEGGCVFGCDVDGGAGPDAPVRDSSRDVMFADGPIECSDTIEEVTAYIDATDNIMVQHYDLSLYGGMPPLGHIYSVFAPTMMAPAPDATEGSCVYYQNDLDGAGSVMRGMQMSQNIGTVSMMHGGQAFALSFVAAGGGYGTTDYSFMLRPGQPLTVSFPGSTAFVAGMGTVVAPPTLTPDDVGLPSLTRSSDALVQWVPPTTNNGDKLATLVEIYPTAFGGASIVCAVPTCRGQATIPRGLLSRYPAGTAVRLRVSFVRAARMSPETRPRPLYLRASSIVVNRVSVM